MRKAIKKGNKIFFVEEPRGMTIDVIAGATEYDATSMTDEQFAQAQADPKANVAVIDSLNKIEKEDKI